MDVAVAGQFALVFLLPTALLATGLAGPRAIRTLRRRVRHCRAADTARPAGPPIEHLAADLRRLLRRHDALKASPAVASRGRHLQAIEAAIADCAAEAARALGLACPERPRHAVLATADLRRLLRALTDAGLMLVPATGLLAAEAAED
jgi:hypothetical protein